MASSGNSWQHRKADTVDERFGLLDRPTLVKYRRYPIFEEPQGDLKKRSLKAMGVTSGIGSMLVGARDMGFEVIGNLEWRDYYRFRVGRPSTFVTNFPGAFLARGVRDVPPELLPEPGELDFVAGHPECGRYSQLSFSVVNGDGRYQETRGTDVSDIPLFLDLISQLKPRFFLMDDLPACFGPFPMSKYIEILPEYDLFPEWISNWGYGNIQKYRNRMFVVGALKSEKFAFVPGEAEHSRVLKDDIFDLIGFKDLDDLKNHATVDEAYSPGRYVNMGYYGHRPTWGEIRGTNSPHIQLPYFTPAGEEKKRPGTLNPKWDGHCPVLSGGYNPLHPIRRLPLSIRERARIQGFPDDFVFHYDEQGPDRTIWEPYNSDGQRGVKQTGKAMPLQFCTYVAAQVKAHIEGTPFEASGRRLLKPNAMVDRAKRDFCEISGYANPEGVKEACWLGEPVDYYRSKTRKPLRKKPRRSLL